MTWACRLFTTAVLLGNGWVFVHALDPKSDLSIGQTWPLFVALIPAFGAMFLVVFRRAWKDIVRVGATSPEAGQVFWEAIPWTTRIFVPVSTAILFFISGRIELPKQYEGQADRRDGKPVLNNHGRVREITEEEHHEATRSEVCHFAGIAIVFSWIATAVVWTIPAGPPRPPRPPYGRW